MRAHLYLELTPDGVECKAGGDLVWLGNALLAAMLKRRLLYSVFKAAVTMYEEPSSRKAVIQMFGMEEQDLELPYNGLCDPEPEQ